MRRLLLLVPFLLTVIGLSSADVSGQDKKKKAPAKPQLATPAETFKVAKGFKVELLYSVPKETEGSWVNLCVDPKGRLITSDQYGPLYRITVPPLGSTEGTKVEQLPADVGDAQGLLWAFDALYVMSNSHRKLPSGTQLKPALYRVTSSKNDDTLDKVEMVMEFGGAGGEHGTHAILPHPDGKRLTLVCGNQTQMPKYDTTKVPPIWGEDHLLPRMPDGNGFMRGVMGPGGFMVNVDPDGKNVELFSVGFRNQYDAAYNAKGELFSYDADMEWDMNTPWYRPTRVCLVTSGSEFGWRNGAGKFPAYYADNLPGICNIGPGSPTGVCFGYGAKFPSKYQNAFFICDWSYGKLYAIHTEAEGSGYKGVAEEFVTGTPLALTDVVINPKDGAMYFTVGGRKTQGGLYRVTYTGSEATDPVPAKGKPKDAGFDPHTMRTALEDSMGKQMNDNDIDGLLKMMGSHEKEYGDRFLRFTARTALEHQDPKRWANKALAETNPQAAIQALLALTRVSAACPEHDKAGKHVGDPKLRGQILASLAKIDFTKLTHEQKLDLVRVYHVLFNRFGQPSVAERKAWLAKFDPVFPTKNRYVDCELLQVYVYLEAANAATIGAKLLASAPTQEEQMEYARALRVLKTGWTPALRMQYAEWFVAANSFRGGNSMKGFMKIMRDDFEKTLSATDKTVVAATLKKAAAGTAMAALPPKPFVKKWTIDELAPKLEVGLKSGRDFEHGRKLFSESRCFSCHRYDNDGSSYGPDLSAVSGRFGPKDLLESILDPNKEISDQYAAVEFELEDGGKVIGRIVNLGGDGFSVNTDMLDPNAMRNINRSNIASFKLSKQSMMPAGLLDVLKDDEVLDLMAYLLSRGDRNHTMFKK